MRDAPTPQEEARHLLELHGQEVASRQAITQQFDVIQARTQALIGLATLALTITGFSGPRIAASNPFSRYAMVLGLVLTLGAMAVALIGALRIRWLTQITADTPAAALTTMIVYREEKTRRYRHSLLLLVAGLTAYVASVVGYMLSG